MYIYVLEVTESSILYYFQSWNKFVRRTIFYFFYNCLQYARVNSFKPFPCIPVNIIVIDVKFTQNYRHTETSSSSLTYEFDSWQLLWSVLRTNPTKSRHPVLTRTGRGVFGLQCGLERALRDDSGRDCALRHTPLLFIYPATFIPRLCAG